MAAFIMVYRCMAVFRWASSLFMEEVSLRARVRLSWWERRERSHSCCGVYVCVCVCVCVCVIFFTMICCTFSFIHYETQLYCTTLILDHTCTFYNCSPSSPLPSSLLLSLPNSLPLFLLSLLSPSTSARSLLPQL